MKKYIFIFFIILQIISCNLLHNNKIKGTWYFEYSDAKYYSEFFFYNKKAYSTSGGLGPVESYYSIDKDSIVFYGLGIRKKSIKYQLFKDSVYLFFDEKPIVLKKSIIQVNEKVFNFKNKTDLETFFIRQTEREKKNYNAHFK